MPTKSHIIQVVPNLTAGDAISNYAQTIHIISKEAGFSSILVAKRVSSDFRCNVANLRKLKYFIASYDPNTLTVIYHHSHGTDAADALFNIPQLLNCRRLMIYHNITPPPLLGFAPALAAQSFRGLEQLTRLRTIFDGHAVAASHFSANDLTQRGWLAPQVFPFCIPDVMVEALATAAAERKAPPPLPTSSKLLYVGRIVPNKGIETLLEILALVRKNPEHADTQLQLIGDTTLVPGYMASLKDICNDLFALAPNAVTFSGKVPERQLVRAYGDSDVFVTASHHEGFCMPAVEAMFAGLPIVAFECGAIPETLAGGAGLTVPKGNPELFAETVAYLLENPQLRESIRESQIKMRVKFMPQTTAKFLSELLKIGEFPQHSD